MMKRFLIVAASAAFFVFASPVWAACLLEQSTSATVNLVLYQDSSGTNPGDVHTGETIAASEVLLSKDGAGLAAKNEATACTEDASLSGFYRCPLDTTDTNTVGTLDIVVNNAGSLEVSKPCVVLSANGYNLVDGGGFIIDLDSATGTLGSTQADFIDGNDRMDVGQWLGVAVTICGPAGLKFTVQTDAGNSSTQVKTDLTDTDFDTDTFGGSTTPKRSVVFMDSNAQGKASTIQSFDATNDILSFDDINETPADGSIGCIF